MDPTARFQQLWNRKCHISKFTSSGEEQWIQQFDSNAHDSANEIVTDSAGRICLTGYTEGAMAEDSDSGERNTVIVHICEP